MMESHAVSSTSSVQRPNVVILGGSYAGLSTALNLLRICDGKSVDSGRGGGRGGRGGGRGGRPGGGAAGSVVKPTVQPPIPKIIPRITLLDARDGFFHTVGAPLAHTSRDYIPKAWRKFEDFEELGRSNVDIVQGKVIKADPASMTVTYTTPNGFHGDNGAEVLHYDYLVVATGTRRPWPIVPIACTKSQYVQDAMKHIGSLERSERGIVVVGGGAVGIETAAETKSHNPSKNVTLVHSRAELLSSESLPSDFKSKVLQLLHEGGVDVVFGNRVVDIKQEATIEQEKEISGVCLSGGTVIPADTVIYATSSATPATEFLPSEALGKNGSIPILQTVQFPPHIPNSSHHFAAGDVAAVPGIKLAAGAVNMGKTVASNIARLLNADEHGQLHQEVEHSLSTIPPPRVSLKLVIGHTGAAYSPDKGGVMWGEEVKQRSFGDDMALSRAFNSLGLSREFQDNETSTRLSL